MNTAPSFAQCQQIVQRLACWEFPWDTTRALELALFRTFCAPRIGGVLHATGEFEARAQKRYDDTDLIVSEMVEHGLDSERGARALARMNQIHARFAIGNAEFLYVLSTFVFEPLRWNARFGWRRMTASEHEAWFQFWCEVGRRMGIHDIPADIATFEAYNRDYEAREFRYTEAGRQVGEATREMFAGWFPRPLRPLVRRSIHALLDEPVRTAFGFPPPSAWLQRAAAAALRGRARILRLLPARRRPRLRTAMCPRSYPKGYRIEELGPPPAGTTKDNKLTGFTGSKTGLTGFFFGKNP